MVDENDQRLTIHRKSNTFLNRLIHHVFLLFVDTLNHYAFRRRDLREVRHTYEPCLTF